MLAPRRRARRPGRLRPRRALSVALLRKGRSLDETAEAAHAVRRSLSPADQQRFDQLRVLRSQRAAASLRGPGPEGEARYQASLSDLEARAAQIEQDLAGRSAAVRAQQQLPSPDDVVARVAAALPPDAALVEYLIVQPLDDRAPGRADPWGAAHFIALALLPDGTTRLADLGARDAIDAAARALRTTLADPRSTWRPAAQSFARLAFAPVQAMLGDVRHVLLSLDGELHQVPFEALDDGRGALLERYRFTYLTSGRDVLRPRAERPTEVSAVILADPTFAPLGDAAPPRCEPRSAPTAIDGSSRGASGFTLRSVPPLPCTRREAEAIHALLPSSRVLVGDAATEDALLALDAPGVLHVATHGIFLDDVDVAGKATRGLTLTPDATPTPGATTDPLVRSALVFAGAATPHDATAADASDGLATALEVASMNLWGTRLVVLSACDTARGAARRSQGVYGLRRALFVAGAETVVTSLWQVDDATTRDLMTRYYQSIVRGAGRAEALREAALSVRAEHAHPAFWAPFIAIGNEGPLPAALRTPAPH